MGNQSSPVESLFDLASAWVANTYDTYGWILPALLLTLCFFSVVVALSWALEDLPLDLETFSAPAKIFDVTKKWWRSRIP